MGRVFRLLFARPGSVMLMQNPDDRATLLAMGIPEYHIVVIPGSGVDTETLRPLPEPPEPITVGYVGRLLDDKGVRTLVRAYRQLREQGMPVALVLAGTPDRANPASLPPDEIAAWKHEPGIDLPGQVEDISKVWQRAHIAALPSRREGLPKSLLEAAACGRPMVATDVPGCREVVLPGKTGLLVPVDDPAKLAEAIQKLAATPELRKSYGAAARQLAVERFSAKAIGEQVVRLYDKLSGKEAGR